MTKDRLRLPCANVWQIAVVSVLAFAAFIAAPTRLGSLDVAYAQPAPNVNFSSGFEPSDPQPTWQNTPETDPQGHAEISGVAGAAAAVGGGPTSGPGAPFDMGFTGLHSFEFSGQQTGAGRGYAYYKVFSVNVLVTKASELSYEIFPVREPNELGNPSTYAAIDLHFTDGTYLSSLGAQDQSFVNLDPQAMGASDTLYPDQWNQIVSTIGAVAAGKTIDRIIVAYDYPSGSARPNGPPLAYDDWFDDISIAGNPPQTTLDPVEYTAARPSDYVVTTRGTNESDSFIFSRGDTEPATAVPNGFNNWNPQTINSSLEASPGDGYLYAAENDANNLPELSGFACSHEQNPALGDYNYFSFLPTPGPIADRVSSLPFSHANEIAQAHYYSVTFEDGLRTEITPTDHAAVVRFTFTGNTSTVTFDVTGLSVDPATDVVTGTGFQGNVNGVFFYAKFDAPITASSGSAIQFDTSAQKVVTMRIASSFISVAQAEHNLALEISPTETFATVEARAQALWDKRLGAITVEGANNDQLTTLYSDLYRLNLTPNNWAENTGTAAHPHYVYFSPLTNRIVSGTFYDNSSFSDAVESEWPLLALLYPTETGQMINGFVQQYKDGGWIGDTEDPGYTPRSDNTGSDSDLSFADAYLKGVTNFDVTAAYDAALKDATVSNEGNLGVGRVGLDTSIFLGYTPNSNGQSTSWSEDNGRNDFGIANMAKALYLQSSPDDPRREEYLEEYEYFLSSSLEYVNEFDPAIGFFQGKTASGQWALTPQDFEPREWGDPYVEASGWDTALLIPWDGQGLANLYGGRAQMAAKLDQLFSTPESTQFTGPFGGVIHEIAEARDVRLGQYDVNNETAYPIPYMYDYVGEPYKAQAIIRAVDERLFVGSGIGQGYVGDDDSGAYSSLQVFNALGLYPLQRGTPYYVIGPPLYKEATVHLENGKKIVINAPNNSAPNMYIQALNVDGKPYDKTYISQNVLEQGAVLDFDMGPKPSHWGTTAADAPPSVTVGNAVPVPMHDATGPGNGVATGSQDTNVAPLFDNTSTTQVTFSSQAPWVQYKLSGGPQKVTFYTLTSGANVGGDPSSWTLEGSNDGLHWTTLDQRQAQTFPWRLQTRPFKVADPGSYSYYKVDVTQTTGGMPTTLAEVEFLVGGSTSFDGEGPTSIEGPATLAASPITAGVAARAATAGASAGQPGTPVAGSELAIASGSAEDQSTGVRERAAFSSGSRRTTGTRQKRTASRRTLNAPRARGWQPS